MPLERFGKYQLERLLARGGMAEVFLARQSGPAGFQKLVVIKRVAPQLAGEESFRGMFMDEARIAARLDHPGIVQIFDFGETDGSYYIAMEYLAGEDFAALLQAELSRRNTVPPAVVARMLCAVCDALHYVHTFVDESDRPLNIVHRDLSPSNLFLTYSGAVKVLDFGLAKAEGKQVQTLDGQIKGKFHYMSPEQIFGERLDARSDVFALGAVMHELVAGQPTFQRDEPVRIFKAITEEPITPLTDLVPGISEDFDRIAAKALERDRAKRFQSALELRRALDGWLGATGSGPSTSQLQDYVRALIPADEVQRKTRPLAVSAPSHRDAGDAVELDRAPTSRRLEVVDERGEPAKVASTLLALEPVSADAETPREPIAAQRVISVAGETGPVDQAGETVLDAPAFKRDQVAAPPPKRQPLRPSKGLPAKQPAASDDGPPTDRGIDVAALEVEAEVATSPTRPSQPSLPQAVAANSRAGPRSWPTIEAAETARGETRSPFAAVKRTQIVEPVGDDEGVNEPPRAGVLARLGLHSTRDVLLAAGGLVMLVAAAALLARIL